VIYLNYIDIQSSSTYDFLIYHIYSKSFQYLKELFLADYLSNVKKFDHSKLLVPIFRFEWSCNFDFDHPALRLN